MEEAKEGREGGKAESVIRRNLRYLCIPTTILELDGLSATKTG